MRYRATNPSASLTVRNAGDEIGRTPEQVVSAQPTYEDGYDAGWAACEAQASAEVQALQDRLQDLGERLPQALAGVHEKLADQYCQAVTSLAFAVAESIIRREIDRATITPAVIRDALAMVPPGDEPRLRLNPADLQCLQDQTGALPFGAPQPVPDVSLQPGEAVLECRNGYLDATLNGRLDQLRQAIDHALEEGPHVGHP